MCSWQTLTSLSVPRCHAGLVNIHGRLYLVGGRSADSNGRVFSVDSIDRYDEYFDEWQLFAKLRTARHDAACAAVGPSRALHIYRHCSFHASFSLAGGKNSIPQLATKSRALNLFFGRGNELSYTNISRKYSFSGQ